MNLLLGPLLSENCTLSWQEFVKMIKIGQDDQDWSRLDKIIKSDQETVIKRLVQGIVDERGDSKTVVEESPAGSQRDQATKFGFTSARLGNLSASYQSWISRDVSKVQSSYSI